MSAISIPCPECGQALKIRDRSLLGRKAKCPKCSYAFVLQEPSSEEVELRLASTSAPIAASWSPAAGQSSMDAPASAASTSAVPMFPGSPVASIAEAPLSSAASRLKANRRRQRKKSLLGTLVTLAVLGLGGGGGYYVWTTQVKPNQKVSTAAMASTGTVAKTATAAPSEPTGTSVPPTDGKPIPLQMIPAGARTILHLRPAELWAAESPGEEFRFCLGPLGEYVDRQITQLCQRPPADIEELTLAWIPGQRGTAPDLSVVVRLKREAKKSQLLDMLGGEIVDTYGYPVYIKEGRAAVIADLKTYAIGPATMAQDLAASVKGENPMPTGVEDIVKQSDRLRHMTLIFEPTAVLLDAEFMAPQEAQPFLKAAMDWFGEGAETIGWSLHLEADRMYSQMTLRNTTLVRASALENTLRQHIDQLPAELLGLVRMMQPREQGKRSLIGRLPAMTKVVSMATLTEHGPRHVQLITPLPDRAAPNLALASLLAWDESTRTDFTRRPPPSGTESQRPAMPVADRLKQKIDVDFRRTPLQEAFGYISDESKIPIDLDGDALKLSGYTQNMPQTFKLDQVTAREALAAILKNYDQMCLVLDEGKQQLVVMTFPVAKQRGLTPMDLSK